MFVLFVDIKLKPGSQQALEKTYTEIFRPAITRQEGFRACRAAALEPGRWRISAQHRF